MKALAIAIVVCAGLVVAGCGGGTPAGSASPAFSAESGGIVAHGPTYKGEPEVRIPKSPPPKKLEIRELKEGTGAEAKKGDWVEVNFVAAGFKTKKKYETTWDNRQLFQFPIEGELSVAALARGVKGMRVGGRRELIAPAHLVYGREGVVFVVDLMKVGE